MYTIFDADSGKRFSTTNYEDLRDAERERNRLAIRYGKEFCLRVAAIDAQGNLHDIEEMQA